MWKKVKVAGGYSLLNSETKEVRGSSLTEKQADRMLDRLMVPIGKRDAPAGSMNVPYQYPGGGGE